MLPKTRDLSHEDLIKMLHYSVVTGTFTWLQDRQRGLKGTVAGCLTPDGYINIKIDHETHRAHRLAWFYITGSWPVLFIDHENRNRSNNAWHNLREATKLQNSANAGMLSNNTSGFRGVHKFRSRWRAGIRIEGKQKSLGVFDTREEAAEAYNKAAAVYFDRFT